MPVHYLHEFWFSFIRDFAYTSGGLPAKLCIGPCLVNHAQGLSERNRNTKLRKADSCFLKYNAKKSHESISVENEHAQLEVICQWQRLAFLFIACIAYN